MQPTPDSRNIVIRWHGDESSDTKELLQQVADAYIQAHHRPADTTQLDARRDDLTNNIKFWDTQLETTSRELDVLRGTRTQSASR